MVGGLGLYAPFEAKAGRDQILKDRAVVSETKTATAANQNGTEFEIPDMGDLVGMEVALTCTAAGTLVTAAGIDNSIAELRLKDSANKPIMQNIPGTALNGLQYAAGPLGKKETIGTATDATAVSNSFWIPMSVDRKNLPGKVQVVYAPYSVLAASGCTGATYAVAITFFYRDGAVSRTMRIQRITESMAIGTNSIASKLPRGELVHGLIFAFDEDDLTSITISADGSEELELSLTSLLKYMATARVDAKITDWLIAPMTPLVVSDKTVLKLVADTADTLNLYVMTADAE